MISGLPSAPGPLRRFNRWLLLHYPEIWSTRAHWFLFYAGMAALLALAGAFLWPLRLDLAPGESAMTILQVVWLSLILVALVWWTWFQLLYNTDKPRLSVLFVHLLCLFSLLWSVWIFEGVLSWRARQLISAPALNIDLAFLSSIKGPAEVPSLKNPASPSPPADSASGPSSAPTAWSGRFDNIFIPFTEQKNIGKVDTLIRKYGLYREMGAGDLFLWELGKLYGEPIWKTVFPDSAQVFDLLKQRVEKQYGAEISAMLKAEPEEEVLVRKQVAQGIKSLRYFREGRPDPSLVVGSGPYQVLTAISGVVFYPEKLNYFLRIYRGEEPLRGFGTFLFCLFPVFLSMLALSHLKREIPLVVAITLGILVVIAAFLQFGPLGDSSLFQPVFSGSVWAPLLLLLPLLGLMPFRIYLSQALHFLFGVGIMLLPPALFWLFDLLIEEGEPWYSGQLRTPAYFLLYFSSYFVLLAVLWYLKFIRQQWRPKPR